MLAGTEIDELFHHVNNFYIDNPQPRHNVYELDADVINSPSFGSVTKSVTKSTPQQKDADADTDTTMDNTDGNPGSDELREPRESTDEDEDANGDGDSSQPKDGDKTTVDGDTSMTDAEVPGGSQPAATGSQSQPTGSQSAPSASQQPTNSQPQPQQSQTTSKNNGNDNTWGLPNVKEEFQEYVWDLLRQQKDFLVGPKNEWGHLSLKEVVERIKARGTGGASGAQGKEGQNEEEEQELRVYATLDRRWRALTGHGPNPKKVSNTHFPRISRKGKLSEAWLRLGFVQSNLPKQSQAKVKAKLSYRPPQTSTLNTIQLTHSFPFPRFQTPSSNA